MPEVAQKHGIAYPIVADTAGATFKAYRVNGTPDYFLIDRAGTIRFADITNAHIEDAIRFLLAEPAPAAAPN
jgi:peroxiredoxin